MFHSYTFKNLLKTEPIRQTVASSDLLESESDDKFSSVFCQTRIQRRSCGPNRVHFYQNPRSWTSVVTIPPSNLYSIHPFLQIIPVENSSCGQELNLFRPPNSSDNLSLLFCLYPSSMAPAHGAHYKEPMPTDDLCLILCDICNVLRW